MKHRSILLLLCITTCLNTNAQKPFRNNIYGEAYGFAGKYAVNYERFQPLLKNRLFLVGLNAGLCIEHYKYSRGFAIPVGLKICVGWKGVYGEIGGDYLFVREAGRDFLHGGSFPPKNSKFRFIHFGIRYQPHKLPIFLRGFVFPFKPLGENGLLLYYYGKPDYIHYRNEGKSRTWWGGIDIGYAF